MSREGPTGPHDGIGSGGASRVSVRFDLFSFLPDAAREDFLAAVKRRVVRSGSTVYTQTDVEEAMFRIVRGEISLSRLRADGRALLIYVMPRGDCFGVSTLIDGYGQPHTATARSDVLLQAHAVSPECCGDRRGSPPTA